MRKVQSATLLPIVFTIISGVFLVGLLIAKYQLGISRYFDVDELAYLHWAHNVFTGSRPYLDFFFYVPPGFIWFLSRIYTIVGGVHILVASRVLAFGIFVGMCVVLGGVFVYIRGSRGDRGTWGTRGTWGENIWLFLLPGIILSFLPLPADKMLEIRPDNLAILLAMAGMLLQMIALERSGKNQSSALHRKWWVGSGVLYGLSLFVLPKTLPQALVAMVVAMWVSPRAFVWLLGGITAAFVPFGIWVFFAANGFADVDTVMYSLTKLPLEVNRIGEIFYMQPDLFFYPNATYYGVAGWSRGLMANHVVWTIGLLIGVWRMFTPFLSSRQGSVGAWKEILVSATLLAYIVTFMYGYPMRHAQYLIPIAVFVSLFAADGLVVFWNWASRIAWSRLMYMGVFVVLGWMAWTISQEVNAPKFTWTNTEDTWVLETVLATVPQDAYIFDLVGATIYYKDPYYVCCLPYGQFAQYLSRPLPDTARVLESRNVRYIYEGRVGRVKSLPVSARTYIESLFSRIKMSGLYEKK